MGDEMDPCECLWNHELAMRRLISLLRQGQSYCTDSECLDELPGLPAATGAGGSFLVLFLTLALAVAMYAMRPRSRALTHDAAIKPLPNPPRPEHTRPVRVAARVTGRDSHSSGGSSQLDGVDHDDGAPPTPPRI